MVLKPDIHNPNDTTNKFLLDIMPEKVKNYFKLPGKFKSNFPTKIFKRDGSEREMDWLILVECDDRELLTLVEFQSYVVGEEKIKVIADCADYSKIYYGRPVLAVIIITDGFESSQKEYHRTSSDIFKPIYIRMTWDEISKRLNNLETKIINHEKLSDDEALDIVYLPMFAPKDKAKSVTRKVTYLLQKDDSLTEMFRVDIAFGLSLMIRKYFDLTEEGKELLNLINPELKSSRLRDVVDFEVEYWTRARLKEFDETLLEKDKSISEKDKSISDLNKSISDLNRSISEKNEEISRLKAKLKAHGLE